MELQFNYDGFVIDSRTVDPTYLGWSFYGYAPLYGRAIGIVESACGILVLVPRPTTLGALAPLAITLNITVLDFAFRFPAVKYTALALTKRSLAEGRDRGPRSHAATSWGLWDNAK